MSELYGGHDDAVGAPSAADLERLASAGARYADMSRVDP
jgi:hypothetical protein